MTAEHLFLPCGSRYESIKISSLLYIHEKDGCTEIISTEKSFITPVSLQRIERALPKGSVCRVHDAYLVSLSKIISFDRRTLQLPGIRIPVARKFMASLKEKIRIIAGVPDSFYTGPLAINRDGRLITVSTL